MGCSSHHVSFILLLAILLLAAATSHAAHGAAITEVQDKEQKEGVLIGSDPPNCDGRCLPSCAGICKSVLVYWSPPATARKIGRGATRMAVMPSLDGAPDYKPLEWACECLPN